MSFGEALECLSWHGVQLLRVRFHIIRNARIENVGKSQSCMVSELRIIWKQTVDLAAPPSCKVGDSVQCPGSGGFCAGNECCAGGSTCPSADPMFQCCPKPKVIDCTKAGPRMNYTCEGGTACVPGNARIETVGKCQSCMVSK